MENTTELNPMDGPRIPQLPKRRHGCVTALLVFMIIVNSLTGLVYLFARDMILSYLPVPVPPVLLITLGIIGFTNTAFAIMLFQWKKIGFYGFVLTSMITLGINISIGLGIVQSMLGLIGVALLYGVLQMKEKNVATWDHLE